jgi:outer membrane protein OmpA-like peptidoglycan-associated protein
MGANRFSISFVIGIAFSIALLIPYLCRAQEAMDPQTGLPRQAVPGECADLPVPRRVVSAVIVSCDKQDSAEVTMLVNSGDQGDSREKTVRGAYEFRQYQIGEQQMQEQAFDALSQSFDSAGFKIKFSSSPATITARKEDTWILAKLSGDYYDVTVVRAKETPWAPVRNAQEISQEMEAHKRVAIYGVAFSPDNQAVDVGHSGILGEVLTYLQVNPAVTFDVESHKMTNDGNAEADLEISRKRAKAVVDCLQAHGVAAGRLQPKGLGRTKPITENDTAQEIQRNERIEFVKLSP